MRNSKAHREEGAALVETAIASAIMVGLLLGLFEMFLAFYSYHYVAYAAREGCRWAIVRGANCASTSSMPGCNAQQSDIQTYVQDLGFPGINANNVTVTAAWLSANVIKTKVSTEPINTTWSACSGSGCNAVGNAVQVKVSYALPVPLPFFQNLSLNLTSTSQMVISQ